MQSIITSLSEHNPQQTAIQTGDLSLTYAQLLSRVLELSLWLTQQEVKSVSIYAQNSADWIVIDLACQHADIIFTPIPLFFSDAQFNQLIASVKPELLFSDQSTPYALENTGTSVTLGYSRLTHGDQLNAPLNTSKITYTSGSTGDPKGVCLSLENQLKVAGSLVDVIALNAPKHLCLLPLPTLLENIAGVYSPLLAGGTVVVASDNERGFDGSRLVNPQQLLSCISANAPNSLILVPELLQVLVMAVKNGWQPPSSLKFIAVGGSRIASSLVATARRLQLPVFQGYGLSECSSVVSLCTGEDDINSAGRILPHIDATIENSELIVSGNTFLGYLEDPTSWYPNRVNTGDITRLENGFLYIDGRSKNTIINSFGRNISPEWVESELLSTGLFHQAVLVGDSKPFCTALLVPIMAGITRELIDIQINRLNASLPDYAQVKWPIVLQQPMSFEQGLYTANMRPRRSQIYQRFEQDIEHVYAHSHA